MTEIDDEIIQAKVDEALRLHNLKRAHSLLGTVRSSLRSIEHLLEPEDTGTPDPHADAIEHLIANDLENIMWNIEQDVIQRQGGVIRVNTL
jgi:hypothetical protein